MFRNLFSTLGRILSFIGSFILTAILVVVTWAFWGYYQGVILQNKFAQEGQLRTVTIGQATYDQRSWRDVLTNTAYLTFQDHGKTYTTRYAVGPGYVGLGDQVQLLYHPDYDAFQQPPVETHSEPSVRESRLVRWSTVSTFSNETKLLLLCLVLTTVAFFMASGLIVTILPLRFLQDIARLALALILLIVAAYFSYDTFQYFQYYQQLKANGQQITVQVLDTDRRQQARSSHGRHRLADPIYYYQATVQYQQQKRKIAINKTDFETLKPGATLRALYAESLDDLMSVHYPPDYMLIAVPVFFWIVALVVIRTSFVRPSKKQQSVF